MTSSAKKYWSSEGHDPHWTSEGHLEIKGQIFLRDQYSSMHKLLNQEKRRTQFKVPNTQP